MPEKDVMQETKDESRRHLRIAVQKLAQHAEDPNCASAIKGIMDVMAFLAPRTLLG